MLLARSFALSSPCFRALAPALLTSALAALTASCSEASDARDLLARGARVVAGPTPESGALTLQPGQEARLELELRGVACLALAGHTTAGQGRLEVEIEERSAESGERLRSRTVPVPAEKGRLATELDLASASAPVALRLRWNASGDPLTLERLELRETRRARVPIILFSIDTLSARHTSLHGYARPTTPNLERLAAEAVVFDECLSNAPFTSPSYSSQFTGLLPHSTWIDPEEIQRTEKRTAKKYETWHVPAERWTLAESLRAAGYRTAAFLDNPMASPSFGFDQGFELYDMSAQKLPIDDPDGGIRTIVPMALAWLDSLPADEPFFLFVNVLDVHGPYGPPPEFRGRFDGTSPGPEQELPVCPDGHEVFGAIPDYNAYTLAKKPPAHLPVAPMVQLYDEEILFVDAELARFVEALRARGILERAALVVTSDHGEMMSEGDFKFGHGVLTQENLQVPLLLRLPGAQHGGRRVARRVELLDLYPTFQELAGLEPRPYLHGRSLLPLCRGEAVPARPVWHDGGLLESTAVTEGRWRLVEWRPGTGLMKTRYSFPPVRARMRAQRPELYADLWGQEDYGEYLAAIGRHRPELKDLDRELVGERLYQLFDVEADPAQQQDLAASQPEIVERLTRLLATGAERSWLARQGIRIQATQLDSALESELRGLGYIGAQE